ncbi:nuclear transport factor 2 family protein [Aliifodinibius sp. S!AR15-10]|uniref:nuclear transport factor 2 family protein n=1 Tax=Aliifodinibius sp. S!AR15-10 TaxID=2950437 RepID=UPI002859C8E9|nr:nuclear transport factor 2 family protein [Aliifodinibius sp. S!AR15-10]MDR8390950.1 nuclear transport factor 2 family protein [Aliifodinibius sp. S!AR15-10]
MLKTASYSFLLLFFSIISCAPENSSNSGEIDPEVTKEVLEHHWETFKANDLEGVMADYTEESVLITPDATYRGLDEIRQNFINAFEAFPADQDPLTLNKSVVVKDIGYILWEASTDQFELRFATDTFVIRDGKIIRQTYGGVTDQDLQ